MGDKPDLISYFNGQFMPHGQATAALQTEDVQSAGGFYDTERTFNGQVFKLRQHLERLNNGLTAAEIDPGMTIDEMEETSLKVLEANREALGDGDEFVLTQVVSQVPAQSPNDEPTVNVVIHCQFLDFAGFARGYVKGVRVITPATYAVPKQSPQSTASEARQRVYLLMTSTEGSITECQGGNFMFVQDGRIKLPDRRNVLPGISMETVLELAEPLGIPVDEGDYPTHDVYVAEEAFVSSTRHCLVPVDTVNGLRLANELPGPVTRAMLDAWRELVGMDFVQQALDHLPDEDRDSMED
ncbi:MAG: aminotransferase class IV [Chloroflexi bacterium]|nr:aminotransferase class IV [Chloroflexota bacterium]